MPVFESELRARFVIICYNILKIVMAFERLIMKTKKVKIISVLLVLIMTVVMLPWSGIKAKAAGNADVLIAISGAKTGNCAPTVISTIGLDKPVSVDSNCTVTVNFTHKISGYSFKNISVSQPQGISGIITTTTDGKT